MYKKLFDAAQSGDMPVVRNMVCRGVDVNARDCDGVTALHRAAKYGHAAIIEYLVGKGADVNAANEFGGTPLQWAAWKGYAAITEFLVSHGANMNTCNKNGDTALHLAAMNGHAAVVSILESAAQRSMPTNAPDRRSAVIALISENDALRSRLGIKSGLEVKPDFDVSRLVEIAIKRRETSDTSLRADVEAEIDFQMEASRMLSDDIDVGNPMRPWRQLA